MKIWTIPFIVVGACVGVADAGTREDELLQAVRKGDTAAVKALLDQGVPVDTKFRYDRTPLSFAADRGHLEIVRLLLERGADEGAADTFYGNTPIGMAAFRGHEEVVRLLLARSTKGVASALRSGVNANKPDVVEAVVATGKVNARDLSYALQAAEKRPAPEAAARLRQLGAVPPPSADATVEAAVLARYAGRYRDEKDPPQELTLAVADGALQATFEGRTSRLGAIDAHHFQNPEAMGVTLEMRLEEDRVVGATLTEIASERRFQRVEEAKP